MASTDAINLDCDDELTIACGQVFLTRKDLLIITCVLCYEKYGTYRNFLLHLSREHFNTSFIEAAYDQTNKTNAISAPESETVDHSDMERNSPLDIDLSIVDGIKDDPEFISEQTKSSETDDGNNKVCTEIEAFARKEPEQIHTPLIDNRDNIEEQNLDVELPIVNEMEDDPGFAPKPTKANEAQDDNDKEPSQYENSVRKEPKPIRTLRRSNRLAKTHSDKENTQSEDSARKKPEQIRNLKRYKRMEKTNAPEPKKTRKVYDNCDNETTQSEESAGKEPEQIFTIKRYNKLIDAEEYYARKKYFCQLCNAGFTHQSNLYVHKQKHSGIKRHGCTFCEKKFFDRHTLQRHVRTHTGERPFVCKTCGKKFTTQSNIAGHMRQHTNTRPYKCTQCDRRFCSGASMKQHLITHFDGRKYVCKICNAAFKQHGHLKVHIIKTHREK